MSFTKPLTHSSYFKYIQRAVRDLSLAQSPKMADFLVRTLSNYELPALGSKKCVKLCVVCVCVCVSGAALMYCVVSSSSWH